MVARIDLTGKTFNRLTVVSRNPDREAWGFWNCQCICGKTVVVASNNLKKGNVKSCGCFKVEKAMEKINLMCDLNKVNPPRQTHGLRHTPEYNIWNAMWDRCTNPNNEYYELYKDRVPHKSWENFETFYKDVGPRPEPHLTLERVNNSLGYVPGNVVWADRKAQMRNISTNKWYDVRGRRMTQADLADLLGLHQGTLHRWLETMTVEEILVKVNRTNLPYISASLSDSDTAPDTSV